MRRRLRFLALAAALPLVLAGCMMSTSVDKLYALPQLPAEYQSLSARLSEILALGAEYAAPQAGSNLAPVQMVDLDGDGADEALGFFRISSEERPLKIYVFRAAGDDYRQAAVIDGSGASIHSVRYEDMDGDGVREILVSWQVSTEVRTVGVYGMRGLEPMLLMSAPYARYEVVDLDGDNDQELVLLRSDETDTGLSLADYYDWDSAYSGLLLQSTARLSAPVASLQRVQPGGLQGGEPAVFVTSRVPGADETVNAVTDILICRRSELVNIVLKDDTGTSAQNFRYLNIPPADINGDGAMEVPRPAAMLSEPGEDPCWKLYWHSYGADGADRREALTYHNTTDGWYLLIPEGWDGHFTVRQNNASSSVHAATFYSVSGRKVKDELLTIYTLTGTDRESQAAKGGRAILRRRGETLYAIAYGPAYEDWAFRVDGETVSDNFRIILKQLSMGEN